MKRYIIVKCDTTEELENKVSGLMENKIHGPEGYWSGRYVPQGSAFQVQEGPELLKVCQIMLFEGVKDLRRNTGKE